MTLLKVAPAGFTALIAFAGVLLNQVIKSWVVMQPHLRVTPSERFSDFLYRFEVFFRGVSSVGSLRLWATIVISSVVVVYFAAFRMNRGKRILAAAVGFGIIQSISDQFPRSYDFNLPLNLFVNGSGGLVLGVVCVVSFDLLSESAPVKRISEAMVKIVRYSLLLSLGVLVWWVIFGNRLTNVVSVSASGFIVLKVEGYRSPVNPKALDLPNVAFYTMIDDDLLIDVWQGGGPVKNYRTKFTRNEFPSPRMDPQWISEAQELIRASNDAGNWAVLTASLLTAKNHGAELVGFVSGDGARISLNLPPEGINILVEEPAINTSSMRGALNVTFELSRRSALNISKASAVSLFFRERPQEMGIVRAVAKNEVRIEPIAKLEPSGIQFVTGVTGSRETVMADLKEPSLLSLADLPAQSVSLTTKYGEIFFGNAGRQYEEMFPLGMPATANKIFAVVKGGQIRSGYQDPILLQSDDQIHIETATPISVQRTAEGRIIFSGDLSRVSVNGELLANTIWGQISDETKRTALGILLGILITSFKRIKKYANGVIASLLQSRSDFQAWLQG